MNRAVAYTVTGYQHQILGMEITNLLPNKHSKAIGHFVFMDYSPAKWYEPQTPRAHNGHSAHPHRGIATFTYVTHGEFEHYDSKGNYAVVGEGGAQWMKAGNGIVHDEDFSQAFQQRGGFGGGLQFWINLPPAVKKEAPEYKPLVAADFPVINLSAHAGLLKLLMGTYAGRNSTVKTYGYQFMYHLQINGGKQFTLATNTRTQYAGFVIAGKININNTTYSEGELIVFSDEGDEIQLLNNMSEQVAVILFGGEPYREPIVA